MSAHPEASEFDDLLRANERYASSFPAGGFDGVARAGVAMVTCMDSRIDPLGMLGLGPGDAKILRNPGGRVTEPAMAGLVLAVTLLGVRRILVAQHTRCAMVADTDQALRDTVSAAAGADASWLRLGAIADPAAALRDDVRRVRAHPLVPPSVAVGGFVYDVDTGRLEPVV